MAAGKRSQGVGVPSQEEDHVQPSWEPQLVWPLKRSQDQERPEQEFVEVFQTQPSRLMQEKSPNWE